MLFGKLFHAAIRTGDLDATVRFYTEVLGMVVAPRPPIGFPGAWLAGAARQRADDPHLRRRRRARRRRHAARRHRRDRPRIDRVPGYADFKARFERFGLPYRENLVPATPLWQLFVHDPNGVQLELTFHAAAEPQAEPVIAPARRYAARERWFDPAPYRQFSTPPR